MRQPADAAPPPDRAAVEDAEPVERDHVDVALEEWAREHPELDFTPLGLTSRIARLAHILEHREQDLCARYGLERAQFAVLATLRRAGAPFRLSPTEIRHSLMLSAAAVTNRLYRLEAAGLVERVPDRRDRRSLLVALTHEGLRRTELALAAYLEHERRLLSSLDGEELDAVTRSLRTLLAGQEEYIALRRRPRPARAPVQGDGDRAGQPATSADRHMWPDDRRELEHLQRRLARQVEEVEEWVPERIDRLNVGAAFVSLAGLGDESPGSDMAWAAAVVMQGHTVMATTTAARRVQRNYQPGYLALSVGPILEEVVRAASVRPDVLVVNAAGRDHPRGAGLAIQLGAALDMPTIGITDRPIVADGAEAGEKRGSSSPLHARDRLVAFRLRTLTRAKPITVHAAWRTSPELARDVVLSTIHRGRTPEPMQRARQLARWSRSEADRRDGRR